MDLKTYAVHRKLEHDDGLLSYVMRREPVPIHVLEASFADFIRPLDDPKSELLISDYPKLLADTIPVVTALNPDTGGYEVSGDIPETLLDAIVTVHNVGKDDVVAALVDYNLKSVHGKSCKILDSSLKEQAEKTLQEISAIPDVAGFEQTGDTVGDAIRDFLFEDGDDKEPLFDFGDSVPGYEADVNQLLEEAADEPKSEPAEAISMGGASPDEDLDLEDILDGPFEPEEEPETKETEGPDILADDEFELEEEPAADAGNEGLDIDSLADEILAEGIPGAEEEPKQENEFSAALRRIYDRLCADIKAYKLDERLGLAL